MPKQTKKMSLGNTSALNLIWIGHSATDEKVKRVIVITSVFTLI